MVRRLSWPSPAPSAASGFTFAVGGCGVARFPPGGVDEHAASARAATAAIALKRKRNHPSSGCLLTSTGPLEQIRSAIVDTAAAVKRLWPGRQVEVSALTGGITNRNFKVE